MKILNQTEHVKEKFFEEDLSNLEIAAHQFEDCVFQDCDLKGLIFSRSNLVDCQFINCDLCNIKLTNTSLRGVVFKNCKLLGVQWTDLATLINPSFVECNLNYSVFVGLKIKKTNFYKSSLLEVDFSLADLSESDFKETTLLNTRFNGTNLMKSDFRLARDYQIDPTANKIKGARFTLPEAQGLLTGLGIILD